MDVITGLAGTTLLALYAGPFLLLPFRSQITPSFLAFLCLLDILKSYTFPVSRRNKKNTLIDYGKSANLFNLFPHYPNIQHLSSTVYLTSFSLTSIPIITYPYG
jgi:hypothetical protein